MAGGIDDVNSMIFPVTSGSRRSDGNTTLLLLLHPVHGGRTLMGLTDLVVDTGIEQDTLSRRRFTGVDMSHDTNVSGTLKRFLSGHNNLHFAA